MKQNAMKRLYNSNKELCIFRKSFVIVKIFITIMTGKIKFDFIFPGWFKRSLEPTPPAVIPDIRVQAIQFFCEENNIKYYQHYSHSITNFTAKLQTRATFKTPCFVHQNNYNFHSGPNNARSIVNIPQQNFPTHPQILVKPRNLWAPKPQNFQPESQPICICICRTEWQNVLTRYITFHK